MNDILNAALEYLDQGFSVIPINPKTKKPHIKWKKFTEEPPTEEDLEKWWDRWPNANVAIITGKLSGLVAVDADNEEGIRWVSDNLDKTTVYNKTHRGFHSLYQYPEGAAIGNRVAITDGVDIRGQGGYFIAPPSVHTSGIQYEWQFVGGGWDDLPVYRPINGTAITPKEKGNLDLDLTKIKSSPINQPVKMKVRNSTLAQLAGKYFNQGLDYAEALIILKEWNRGNMPPLGEKELIKTIQSIYKTHLTNHPDAIPETPAIVPEDPEDDCPSIDDVFLCPGGVLQEIMEYIDNNSPVSVPLFSLGAALSCLGAVMGQKVMTSTGLRTNLYCISLGYSGSGKNAPFGTIPHLIEKSEANPIIGPSEITSAAAIYTCLGQETKRNSWIAVDEIGQILRGMKNPSAPEAGIPRLMTKLFSAADRGETKSYANSKNDIHIPWHHLCFFGATTPERFWESIGSGEVADGFLARVLIFESLHDAPLPKQKINFSIPRALIKKISGIYNIPIKMDTSSGNIPTFHRPIPNEVPMDDDAADVFHQKFVIYHDLKNKNKQNTLGIASIYGRAAEHAAKIALIHQISLTGWQKGLEVQKNSVEFAWGLMDFLIQNTIKQVETNVSDSEIGRMKQKIVKAIRAYSAKNKGKNGWYGATMRDIQRGPGRGLKTRDLRDIFDSLLSAEIIGKKNETARNGRSVTIYYVAK